MEILHQKDINRFVLPLDNDLRAFVEYRLRGNQMDLVHSEVPYELRGKGIGKELVLKTFEKLTEEGFEATAICGYIRNVAKQHPKWNSIIKL